METLVTLWMIGVMLLLVAELARDIQQESVYNKDHDQRIGAHQALDRIGQALRSAHRILEPISGSAARLRLEGWNPQQNSGRLPSTLASPTSLWAPDSPGFLLERRFEITGGAVLTCVSIHGGVTDTVRLLGEVVGFQAQRESNGTYQLTLSWKDSKGKDRSISHWSGGTAL